jgi:hypothetical protein
MDRSIQLTQPFVFSLIYFCTKSNGTKDHLNYYEILVHDKNMKLCPNVFLMVSKL